MTPRQVTTLAAYNRWMNDRIYEASATLPDAERKKDRRAFFRSLHGTLNHGLLADAIWMSRFENTPYAVPSLDHELHTGFDDLRAARAAMDERISSWANGLDQETLDGFLEYTSVVRPAPRRYDYWLAVTHFFNHQTHHRGQVTALLSQRGVDYGVTDLIWLPGVER